MVGGHVENLRALWVQYLRRLEGTMPRLRKEVRTMTQEPDDNILEEAAELVLEGRVEEYGKATTNWQKIAALWSAYLNRPIEPEQAADMMILVKLGRKATGKPKTDHNRDIAGYALIAEMLEERHRE